MVGVVVEEGIAGLTTGGKASARGLDGFHADRGGPEFGRARHVGESPTTTMTAIAPARNPPEATATSLDGPELRFLILEHDRRPFCDQAGEPGDVPVCQPHAPRETRNSRCAPVQVYSASRSAACRCRSRPRPPDC